MHCEIIWNDLSLPQWTARFSRIRRAPLLQSYLYARAICPLYGQSACWGLIKIEGQEAGLLQLQEARLLFFHGIIFDRGPLWFEGFGTPDHWQVFLRFFRSEFPRRIGRRLRFIPELADSEENRALLKQEGFRRKSSPGYKTIWLDLTPPLPDLRAGLHKKWRNSLSKAERSNLTCRLDEEGTRIAPLLKAYQEDCKRRGYPGPSLRVLRALTRQFAAVGQCLILEADLKGKTEAAILILTHGRAATYQIGWTTDEGRKKAAHNFLLWQAVSVLKEKGVTDFDLGGINDQEDASGLRQFKERLGGTNVTLVGHYI